MDQHTCLASDCAGAIKARGLCAKHYQQQARSGVSAPQPPVSVCRQCGGELPSTRRWTRRYCSKRCYNAAYRAANRERLLQSMREWADVNRNERRQKDRAAAVERQQALDERVCCVCGATLPPGSRASRRFCSRKCTNARSIIEAKEQRRENHRRYRARRLADQSVEVTAHDWERLVRRYGGRCAYCHATCVVTMDHVVPLSRGGRHSIGNVLPACRSCNASKKHLLLADWRNRILRLRLATPGYLL